MRNILLLLSISGMLGACAQLGDIANQVGSVPTGGIMNQEEFEVANTIGAGADLVKAISLSDDEIRSMALQAADHLDKKQRVAPASSKYTQRLNRLTRKHRKEDGLNLNFRVYMSDDVNAFALADGSIRFYSGLMDMMNDEELLSVVGHEIGHVKNGHSKSRMQWAYGLSAARKGVASQGGVAGQLAATEVGFILEKLLDAQYTQSQETDSDDYGLEFLLRHGYSPQASVSAMEKLASLGGKASMFSSHPAAGDRAERLAKQIQEVEPQSVQYAKKPATETGPEVKSVERDVHKKREQVAFKQAQQPSSAATKKVVEKSKLSPGYYIQVAADESPQEAQVREQKLKNLDAVTAVQEAVVNGATYFRVLVGPYAQYPQNELLLLQTKDLGIAKGTPFLRKVK